MTAGKPYHRQKGEPNLWYDRFHAYMRMGASRNMDRCYREITNAERKLQDRPLLPKSARCPPRWRQRALEYDWKARAEAWDQEVRDRALEKVEQARNIAQESAPIAVEALQAILKGELRDPDGSLTEGQNCTQRRLAAEAISRLAGVTELPLEKEEHPEVLGIVINYPDGTQEDENGNILTPTDPGYIA